MSKKDELSRILNYLLEKGIKKQAIAKTLGVDPSIVSRILKAGVSADLSERYIAFLQSTYKDILGSENIIEVKKTEIDLLNELNKKVDYLIDLIKDAK